MIVDWCVLLLLRFLGRGLLFVLSLLFERCLLSVVCSWFVVCCCLLFVVCWCRLFVLVVAYRSRLCIVICACSSLIVVCCLLLFDIPCVFYYLV